MQKVEENGDISRREEVKGGSITTHYPKGKLNIYDEGATKVAMFVEKERLIIDFGHPTRWIGLGKDEVETWISVMQKRLGELS